MMKEIHRLAILFISSAAATGCSDPQTAPLYFGQATTLGVTIAVSTSAQPGELTLGYRHANFAIVPTVNPRVEGSDANIRATVGEGSDDMSQDALSTFGSFNANANFNGVEIGEFFSTGIPGRYIAQGAACAAAAKAGAVNSFVCSGGYDLPTASDGDQQ